MRNGCGTVKINVSVKCFALVTLFIAETPVNDVRNVKNSRFNAGMVKTMVDGIVDSDKPFLGTCLCHTPSPLLKNLQKSENQTKLQGGNTDPPATGAAMPPRRTMEVYGGGMAYMGMGVPCQRARVKPMT